MTWPHQTLPSYARHAVPVFGDLTHLSCVRSHCPVSSSCFEDTEQRQLCLRQGFCLVLALCSDCRDALLSQTQI